MAQIYEFPTEKILPSELQQHLCWVAETYMYVLLRTAEHFYGKEYTDEQFQEINELVSDGYAKELRKIVDKLGEL